MLACKVKSGDGILIADPDLTAWLGVTTRETRAQLATEATHDHSLSLHCAAEPQRVDPNILICRRPDVCPAEERAALELLEGCLRKFNKAG